ncbi:hypothetical protein [Psychroserpens mesophilus]|uniref:hypothetical protein n=1 Tax=Psychroserpens mesophilus TaxID=325473 RepID=UPI003D64D478
MKKLTKEHIQFIENYLENSDVYYADIRMEMTDHVASAIESKMELDTNDDFYIIFKNYMVENKANLLENNRKFLKDVDKSISKRLFKILIKPSTIVITILMCYVCFNLLRDIEKDQLISIISWLPVLSIVPVFILYGVTLKVFRLSRFSGVERLGFVYVFFYQLLNLFTIFLHKNLQSETINYLAMAITSALMITFTIALLELSYRIIKQYRTDYKFLAQ